MYDHNPFREAAELYKKAISEQNGFDKKAYDKELRAMTDPIFAELGWSKGPENRIKMREALKKKEAEHRAMVERGEMSQEEFDKLKAKGEFDITEQVKELKESEDEDEDEDEDEIDDSMAEDDGETPEENPEEYAALLKRYEESGAVPPFKGAVPSYKTLKKMFKEETYKGDPSLERLGSMQAPEGYGDESAYHAKMSQQEHEQDIKTKIHTFLRSKSNNKNTINTIMRSVSTANVDSSPGEDASLVKTEHGTFHINHSTGEVRVVS